jgi:hypothetical protein
MNKLISWSKQENPMAWNGDEGDAVLSAEAASIIGTLLISILAKHDPKAAQDVMGRSLEETLPYLESRYGVKIGSRVVDIVAIISIYSARKSNLYPGVFA